MCLETIAFLSKAFVIAFSSSTCLTAGAMLYSIDDAEAQRFGLKNKKAAIMGTWDVFTKVDVRDIVKRIYRGQSYNAELDRKYPFFRNYAL